MSIKLPTEYLSISQVDMYQRCARQYWFRYVEGIIRPPSVALVEGSSHHVGLESNNKQKIESHEDMKEKEVVEVFAETFSEKCKEVEDWEGDTKDTVIARGKGLIKTYMADVSPSIQPVAVEEQFRIDLDIDGDTVPVTGYIDLEQDTGLSDYKVVGRTKSQSDADNSLQLSVYGAAKDVKRAEFICLVKTKKPKVERVPTIMTKKRSAWAAEICSSVARAISAGVFPPCDPASWACSERFCGYWHLCRGK